MNEIKFSQFSSSSTTSDSSNISFYPTSMDASIYFIQQYCKLICDNLATLRNFDETFPEHRGDKKTTASNEHRFILLTFNELEGLQLRSTWKDSYSTLQEELKNISFEARSTNSNSKAVDSDDGVGENSITKKISNEFEAFMDKFEASYFNCSLRTGGHFIFKESESVFTFTLSHDRDKLQRFDKNLKSGWQRRNTFIQFHPNSFVDFQNDSLFNFFPVTNLRDSDQLARTLYYANNFNSFETVNMERLGRGGLVDFILEFENESSVSMPSDVGLMRPNFSRKPKWPVPNCLTGKDWNNSKPKLFVKALPRSEANKMRNLPFDFDEYITYAPDLYFALKDRSIDSQTFVLSTNCNSGNVPIGFCELIPDNYNIISNSSSNICKTGAIPLVKVSIGPFDLFNFSHILQHAPGKFLSLLRTIPQFYEYFFQNILGDSKYFELCKQRSWRNEFNLPEGLIESKNAFRSSFRQSCKNDLGLMVERCENSHRWRVNARQAASSHHSFIFPSLRQLKADSGNFNRLNSKFKTAIQVFLASCDHRLGSSVALHQSQLSQVLFKHSLPVNQMTDFSESMRKKRTLRPLFNEGEIDLFYILKEMPTLQEEMATAHFVNGDIFGNPYKQRNNNKKSRFATSTSSNPNNNNNNNNLQFTFSTITDESLCSEADSNGGLMSPMSIDEIDFKEMEDVGNEIILNGSLLINSSSLTSSSSSSDFSDLSVFEKIIKSPGGLASVTQFIEAISIVNNLQDLHTLFDLSLRYKRIKFTILLRDRITAISSNESI